MFDIYGKKTLGQGPYGGHWSSVASGLETQKDKEDFYCG